MRPERHLRVIGRCAVGLALAAAGGAWAVPTLDVRGAAARVVVVPQARSDVAVVVLKQNLRLPLRVTRFGHRAVVTGDIGHRSHGCLIASGRAGVRIRGRGVIPYEDLPRIVVYTPLNTGITVGEAVFGAVGRSDSLDFANKGCGVWQIANVRGRLRLNQSGSGRVSVGAAGAADLSVAGAGKIDTRDISGGMIAVSSGAGIITAASVSGPLNVRIAGSGDIRTATGSVSRMTASIAGSGLVYFGGVAGRLDASVAGPGVVRVARVSGPVTRHVFGSGAVRVGR